MININTHFFLEALHVVFMTAYCTLRNETKRNETNQNETNQNETNQNETKQTKPTKTKPTKTKPNKTKPTKRNQIKRNQTKRNQTLPMNSLSVRSLHENWGKWLSAELLFVRSSNPSDDMNASCLDLAVRTSFPPKVEHVTGYW